uniref:Ketoreductase (KR) domain-containing protein n=1 Tax=Alexandrium monilatum TaxID=311494 RepID=A0A7S4QD09_9DINO|eukprot:CAMPEP_0175286816 /NCGR_PEP_ID=MMETSP0093-20121207/53957_1 /TAXON_ID=311494 /ORGANISM="Alexandrium monilatum, Strain CCMP3105" /LENGTH=218 /DNA_ID=CAMNT_0016582291 /DNA_START=24 /DNA_END=680 /DNA_ORIENTATION=+
MAALAGLAQHAKQLERITDMLADVCQEDSPNIILIQPMKDTVNEIHHTVFETLSQATRSNSEPSGVVKAVEEEFSGLLNKFMDGLAQDSFQNPQALRTIRKTLKELSAKAEEMQDEWAKAAKKAAKATGVSRPVAPNMAGGKSKGPKVEDKPMTIEDALSMLVDKRTTKWQGGLVGIVHAAGVQEMTPISAHTPGRFEFVFAPKSQAAWNLHTYATMV